MFSKLICSFFIFLLFFFAFSFNTSFNMNLIFSSHLPYIRTLQSWPLHKQSFLLPTFRPSTLTTFQTSQIWNSTLPFFLSWDLLSSKTLHIIWQVKHQTSCMVQFRKPGGQGGTRTLDPHSPFLPFVVLWGFLPVFCVRMLAFSAFMQYMRLSILYLFGIMYN